MGEKYLTELGVGGVFLYLLVRDWVPQIIKYRAKRNGNHSGNHECGFGEELVTELTNALKNVNGRLSKVDAISEHVGKIETALNDMNANLKVLLDRIKRE